MRTSRFVWMLLASSWFGVLPACHDAGGGGPGGADAGAGDAPGVPDAGPEVGVEPVVETARETVPEPVVEPAREPGPEPGVEPARETGPEPGREPGPEAGVEVAREPGPEAGVEVAREAGADGPADAGAATDGRVPYRGLPQPVCVWNEAYQENYAADTVAEILAGARNCYVLVDPFASADARAAIPQMHQLGNTVACYISVGTCEDWRDDYAAMKPYCVSKQWGDWPGEYFVARTDTGVVALMEARIDKMAAWGCDLVELDNMDFAFDPAYRSQYGITATAAEGEAYNQTLCAYMHDKGMGCMAKSSAQGAEGFDGLTVESSQGNMDWWTASDMTGMLAAGKIGIIVHYDETDCAKVRAQYQDKYGDKVSFICEDRALRKYRHFP